MADPPAARRLGADVLLGAGLAASLGGAVAAAAVPNAWAVTALLVVAAVAERTVASRSTLLRWLFDRAAAWPVTRAVALLGLVLLAARTVDTSLVVGTTATAVVLLAIGACGRALELVVRHLRRPPLLSRNLDLGDLALPRASRRLFSGPEPLGAAAVVVVAIGLAAADGDTISCAVALAVAAAVAALPVAMLAMQALRLRRSRVRQRTIHAVTTAVEQLRPQVAIYFAGTPEEVYQPNMWLRPVEDLGVPALVVVRDPEALARLATTTLPVVCTPYNGTIAKLPLPPSLPTLFVTHSGNNVAMLRRREVRSVFVGHGDSDKPDSVNPFARVYEQIWVAGPLGRQRYAEADIGVRREAVVEVGRPQLEPPRSAPAVPTVLYAPTWEGWGDDPHHSSLPHAGPALVAALVAHGGLRVIYRPHPLTGRRDPAVRTAHAAVLGLLRNAGAVELRLPQQSHRTGGGDLLDRAIESGRRPTRREDRAADPAEAAWSAAPVAAHRIAGPDGPGLASCFAQASLLVADISSVVSDYLAVDRPYALIDTRGVGAEQLRRAFPAARGGLVLGPDLAGADELCEVAAGVRRDPTVARRRKLMRETLGDPATAGERFAAAVAALQ
jgi:hypothetical protein